MKTTPDQDDECPYCHEHVKIEISGVPSEVLNSSIISVMLKKTVKFALATFEIIDGENKYTVQKALQTLKYLPDTVAEEYLTDYFGLTTTGDNNAYWDGDGTRSIKLVGIYEISRGEFDVLKRFIGEITEKP